MGWAREAQCDEECGMDAEELEEARYAHIDINVVPTSWAPWRRRDAEGKGEAPSHVRVSLVGGRIVFRFDQRKKPSGVLSVASSPLPALLAATIQKPSARGSPKPHLAHVAPRIRSPHRPRFPTSSNQYPHTPDNRFMTC